MRHTTLKLTYGEAIRQLEKIAESIQQETNAKVEFPMSLPLPTSFNYQSNAITIGKSLLLAKNIYKELLDTKTVYTKNTNNLLDKYNQLIPDDSMHISDSTFVFYLFKMFHEGEHARQQLQEYQDSQYAEQTMMRFACLEYEYYCDNYNLMEFEIKADMMATQKTYEYLCNECNLKPKKAEKLVLEYVNFYIQEMEETSFSLSGQGQISSWAELIKRFQEQYDKCLHTNRQYINTLDRYFDILKERMPFEEYVRFSRQIRQIFQTMDENKSDSVEYDYIIGVIHNYLCPNDIKDFKGIHNINMHLNDILQYTYHISKEDQTFTDKAQQQKQIKQPITINVAPDAKIKFKNQIEQARQSAKNQRDVTQSKNIPNTIR